MYSHHWQSHVLDNNNDSIRKSIQSTRLFRLHNSTLSSLRPPPPSILILTTITILKRIVPNFNRILARICGLIMILVIPRRIQTNIVVLFSKSLCRFQRRRIIHIVALQIIDTRASHASALFSFELRSAFLGLFVHEPARRYASDCADSDGEITNRFGFRVHFAATFGDFLELATDEDVQHEFGGYDGGCERVAGPVHRGEGGDCAVGERVGERAHANHDEEFEAVVFEREGQGREALVVGDEAMHEVFEDRT
jgi:hypothetical protein